MGSSTSKKAEYVSTIPEGKFPVVKFKSPSSSQCGSFSILPKEIILEILYRLMDKDILSCSIVCHKLYRNLSEDDFWQSICKRRNKVVQYDKSNYPNAKYWYFSQVKEDAKKQKNLLQNSLDGNLVKVVIVGSAQVGKTQLLSALVGRDFTDKYITTIGVDFATHVWEYPSNRGSFPRKFQLWDTAGQERFRNITRAYYRGAHIVLLVYSVADKKSFDDVPIFYQDIESLAHPDAKKILIGTQVDVPKDLRQVTVGEGKQLADRYGYGFQELSAKTGVGVDELKRSITTAVSNMIPTPARREIACD